MRTRTAYLSTRAGSSQTGIYGGPAKPNRRLTDDDKRMVRILWQRGYSAREIGRKMAPRVYMSESAAKHYKPQS